ncbi:hypothetical protein FXE51_14485 [Vibrio mimicus]|uniref:hypothetical protein n=1 Tax=Vibrio mimicus TaxID=674 RepID=UPI0011D3866F|nr:hypothetical protein [Vibrio mimicus]TXZ74615.1 hypothetical protein FXE51_14485 [Vibrio mimicus]
MKILILISFFVVMFCLLVFNHEVIFPGQQAGSVDGWLGFFGGLLGGYLAFISAFYIYNRQKHDSVRPILVVELENEFSGDIFDVAHRDIEVKGISASGGKQIPIRIRNIGLAAALDVECSPRSNYILYQPIPNGSGEENIERLHISGIQESQSRSLDLYVQLPSLVEHADKIVEIVIAYKGVYGKEYEVTAQLILESTNRLTTEYVLRTLKRT